MVFSSFEFLLFFPIVTFLYFAIPHHFRWILLLIASCVFYAFFKWEYILILLFTIIIDYYAGIWIDQTQGTQRKLALGISLAANVGVLIMFKYYYFILGNINAVTFKLSRTTYDPIWDIILPIGLSFHTFQAMSYTIEVYRGHQKVERNFGIYALYVMFYPQLVAGPIERPQNILHQFYQKFDFKEERVASGLRLMLWGFFKKVVIADNLAIFSDLVFGDVHQYQGLPLVVGILCYSIQIYCDFSGYSDIAIGSARVMGFKLMYNFNRPYISKSISEFWKRWHMSLSTWFRDYVYIPLGGNRVSRSRFYMNIMVVFLLSGIWHGASWNFVIWGIMHGVYQIVGHLTKDWQNKILAPLGKFGDLIHHIATLFFVAIAWVFFRAETLRDAKYYVMHLFSKSSHTIEQIVELFKVDKLVIGILGVITLFIVERIQGQKAVGSWVDQLPKWKRWGIYYALTFIIITCGYYGKTQFIYFQF